MSRSRHWERLRDLIFGSIVSGSLPRHPVHSPPTIVLYGHNELLLMKRARVLEDAGFRTSIALDVREIPRLVRKLSVDLIVLGNTLSRTECVVAGMVAKNHRTTLQTLLIVPDGNVRGRDLEMSEVADGVLSLSFEPDELVAKVRAMVGDRAKSSLLVFRGKKSDLRRPPVRASLYPANSRPNENRREGWGTRSPN